VGLESSVTKIEDLNESWPLSTDERRQGDDHLRNIKVALKSLLSDLNQIKIGPADLSGQAGKALVVNTAEDGFDELESFQTAADAASHAADASAHHTKYTDAEATAQAKAIVQDTPQNGVTDRPISSNWAYDHKADASAHHTKFDLLYETPSGNIPGTSYSLSQTPASQASVHLFRNGVLLRGPGQGGSEYSLTGTSITLANSTLSGDWLWVFYEV